MTASQPLTAREIKEFAGTTGPCVTVMLPAYLPGNARQKLGTRLRRAVESTGRNGDFKPLLKPVLALADELNSEPQGQSLVIFRSEDQMRQYWVDTAVPESVVVASNFYIRPLLQRTNGERQFYLLALSQKDVRLLRCSEHDSEEIDPGPKFPRNLMEFAALDQPDHVLDNRSSAGPSNGGGKGVMFGTSSDKEAKDEYLVHFYKAVNDALIDFLGAHIKVPVVLAGVDYELAMYRRVNTYPHLCEEGVQGAPNGMKGGEMHAKALEVLHRHEQKELEGLLAQLNKQSGETSAARPEDVVAFAYQGRVMHLFVAENASLVGSFNREAFRAEGGTGDEDLVNAAAVQTILHSGRVHVLPAERMPDGRSMACLTRY